MGRCSLLLLLYVKCQFVKLCFLLHR
uniref:Uncharacterized protein n=1 Tax=Arundo donax TaxID=35708 RepID=A0A0A9FZC8_ARUDO